MSVIQPGPPPPSARGHLTLAQPLALPHPLSPAPLVLAHVTPLTQQPLSAGWAAAHLPCQPPSAGWATAHPPCQPAPHTCLSLAHSRQGDLFFGAITDRFCTPVGVHSASPSRKGATPYPQIRAQQTPETCFMHMEYKHPPWLDGAALPSSVRSRSHMPATSPPWLVSDNRP